MCLFAEAPRNEHFFLLSLGKILHALFKLCALKFQLAQDRFKKAFVNAAMLCIVAQCAGKSLRALRDIRDHKPACGFQRAGMGNIFAAQ